MPYKFDDGIIGYPPVEVISPAPAAGSFPPISPGLIIPAEDPVFGPGEFIFARANGAIRQYGLCVLTPVWDSTNKVYTQNMTEAPNTANLGRPLFVAQCAGALSAGQYAWFMTTGITPINGSASVAADTAVGITAAGQIGANSAGKQLLNARGVTAATQTVVSASVRGVSGDNRIDLANTQGFIPGGYLSGTGVGAAAIITFVDPLGRYVLTSVANSAAVTGNVTVTYNNATIFYNVVELNRVQAQGPIT